MTQEKQHLCEMTLQDMYLLLKRAKELARNMADELANDNDTARDFMTIAAYMSESATGPLFNCAGALGVDLVSWSVNFDRLYDNLKEDK